MSTSNAPRGGLFSHDVPSEGIRLFDDQDEQMLSPPRMSHKNDGLPTARLFGDLDANANANTRRAKARTRMTSSPDGSIVGDEVSGDDSVLCSMDMNASPHSQRRKRPSDQYPAGRVDLMLESDDDDDMFLSPRVSPSYLTLDGRTVTSKNPFSPYTPDALDATMNTDMQTAPTFPVTLNSSHSHSFDSMDSKATDNSSVSSLTAPFIRPKLNLQRRDTSHLHAKPAQARAGYPDRHGQYSFTGSPIEEIDIFESETAMGSKSRRLHMTDSASSAHSLLVDTVVANNTISKDEISPTDVMQFPPSAPRKPPRYTPLRPSAPHTPIPERRNVARRPNRDYADEEDAMDTGSVQSLSRFYQDFDIIGELGTGSFGTVFKCLSRLDGCMYAIKAANRRAKGTADRDRMLKEVYALAALSDQADTAAFHIVRYHQAWMEENRLYIQTELCTSTLQMEMGRISIQRKWKLLREMLLALKFIHRNGMVHLDIKPENIFIKNDQFKLGDFGLVSKITSHSDVEEGDSRYMSKELLSGDHEDLTKSDIFSLGATMYEICLGRPLPSDGQEWHTIRSGELLPLELNGTPYEMKLIIKEMMHPDPKMRPSASQLLTRKQLLSEEQKQLMAEKSKVLEANLALALQTQKLKKLTPPRTKKLIRSNTWNGSCQH